MCESNIRFPCRPKRWAGLWGKISYNETTKQNYIYFLTNQRKCNYKRSI